MLFTPGRTAYDFQRAFGVHGLKAILTHVRPSGELPLWEIAACGQHYILHFLPLRQYGSHSRITNIDYQYNSRENILEIDHGYHRSSWGSRASRSSTG